MLFESLTVKSKTALKSDCNTHLEMGKSVQVCISVSILLSANFSGFNFEVVREYI